MFSTPRIHHSIALIYGALILALLQPLSAFSPHNPRRQKAVPSNTALNLRVVYQGEPGAYSEKSTRELLGDKVVAIGRPDFEACFKAVAFREADYACLPVENSLGGSIHENYDLMFRYDLRICAEHEFRVQHCILAKEGVKLEDIKFAISHPQALAQCDNYLRNLGITPVPQYDTAGSAKMISEDALPGEVMTPENTCAIASDIAARTYSLNCLKKGAEDDDSNFTRFLLLGRKTIVEHMSTSTPAKTSIVFALPDTQGALYKALACFSMRDIDFSKIESRPTSATLLSYLKFRRDSGVSKTGSFPRFRYCFYLDIKSSTLFSNTENALANLREQAEFVRVLGSYPTKSRLVGPLADAYEELKLQSEVDPSEVSLVSLPSDSDEIPPLKIGIVGFGSFGQLVAAETKKNHHVSCTDEVDKSSDARRMDVDFYPSFETSKFLSDLDIVVLAVPLINLEECISSLPKDELRGKLVINITPLLDHSKKILLKAYREFPDIDILVYNLLGRTSGDPTAEAADLWGDRMMIIEDSRVQDNMRVERYLQIFKDARCVVYGVDSDTHDATIANSEFVSHMTGRLLDRNVLPPALLSSKEYSALSELGAMANGESFDRFYGMYKYNKNSKAYLSAIRENLAAMERQLAAREAYLAAKAEMRQSERHKLLAETRLLLQELVQGGTLSLPEADSSNDDQQPPGDDGDATRDLTLDTKG
ncbi:MAG: hypothetical protein SGBAC_000854 [Bacillariaceae sp.]